MTIAAVLLAGLSVALLIWLRRAFLIVTVRGHSMEPAYWSGDRLLVRRSGLSAVRPGAVVVVQLEADGSATDRTRLVKRAAAVPGDPAPSWLWSAGDNLVPPDRLVVLGDNASRSQDSRQLGYLPGRAVVGIAVRQMPGARDDRLH
ncbi:S26 family signal peptidase [Kribbella catacumbae]|uniref:S26 family signal peptidase n=1 Tax=Kribbella catacumbae TaxID=460086 RepID=UPI00035F1439|nr:S26 family signal peptidase [Kribbella catacumbae]